MLGLLMPDLLAEMTRQMRLRAFQNLRASIDEPGPKLVFMHMLAPHPPYLFKADGSFTKAEDIGVDWSCGEDKALPYCQQAQWAEGEVKRFLEKALSSKRPPIIIIHSDHGPATLSDIYLNHESKEFVRERTGILTACYFPGTKNKKIFNPDFSAVNIGRLLLNTYFQGHYPLLAKHVYFSNYSHPFQFKEVEAWESVRK